MYRKRCRPVETEAGLDPSRAADHMAALVARIHDDRETLSATRAALARAVADNRRLREQLAQQ